MIDGAIARLRSMHETPASEQIGEDVRTALGLLDRMEEALKRIVCHVGAHGMPQAALERDEAFAESVLADLEKAERPSGSVSDGRNDG